MSEIQQALGEHTATDASPSRTLTESLVTTDIGSGLTRTELTRTEVQHIDYGMGIDLVESPMYPPRHWGSRDIIITPEEPLPHTVVAVMPGFGHSADAGKLGPAFEALAVQLSSTHNVVSMVSVENQQEPEGSLSFQIPGYGKARALLMGLNQFPDTLKPGGSVARVVIVGFSNSCLDALVAARRCQKDLGLTIGGIVFAAPTDNPYALVSVMKEAGKPVSVDRHAGKLSVGLRNTPTSSVFWDFREGEPPRGFIEGTDWSIEALAKDLDLHVPVKVLHGIGDPIVPVERSSQFARKVGATLTQVRPGTAVGNAIHDFSDDTMRYHLGTVIGEIL